MKPYTISAYPTITYTKGYTITDCRPMQHARWDMFRNIQEIKLLQAKARQEREMGTCSDTVKDELESSPPPQTPMATTPATPSTSSISFASRTDYANFSGGAVLKQCLLDPQGLLAAAYATPPPAAAANDESSDIDNDGENPLQTPAKKNPKAKAKAKSSCRKKAAPKAQKAIEKPQSLCTKHGLLSIIKAKGRTYISCLDSESKRKQWVQVSEKDAEALDSDPLSVIVDIFRRIEEDDLDCEGAKRVKQEIMQ